MEKNYNHIFIARIVAEAKTPLAVGSGNKDVMTDDVIATDVNGLPYITGASLAGVIRHAIGPDAANAFFGTHDRNGGEGSKIFFSDAKFVGAEGIAVDGLKDIDFSNEFYSLFNRLPVRQHARIDDKGATVKHGKFDEQVVFAGTRFCFEIEYKANDAWDKQNFELVLKRICKEESFRVGSGTRKGFGLLSVKDCSYHDFDLNDSNELANYIAHSTDLSKEDKNLSDKFNEEGQDWHTIYDIELQPEDFFLFGSGIGEIPCDSNKSCDDIDSIGVREKKVIWSKNGRPLLSDDLILIPATSIKGALAHRIAYHYNKKVGIYADSVESIDEHVGPHNKAVRALFGYASDKENDGARGNVLFEDIFEENRDSHIFNHVSIDRYTGGAIEGALFTEKADYGKNRIFTTHIIVDWKSVYDNKDADVDIKDIEYAFNNAVRDMVEGALPLGGCVNKGYGIFTGSVKMNSKEIER